MLHAAILLDCACGTKDSAIALAHGVNSADRLVVIRWHGRNMAVPLSPLVAVDADESTVEAIGDWHYWVAQGYVF